MPMQSGTEEGGFWERLLDEGGDQKRIMQAEQKTRSERRHGNLGTTEVVCKAGESGFRGSKRQDWSGARGGGNSRVRPLGIRGRCAKDWRL